MGEILVSALNGEAVLSAILFAAVVALAISGIIAYRRKSRSGEEYRQAPGSRISLAVGDRFALSDRFAGFVHDESGTSIVLVELPKEAFDRLRKLGNAQNALAAQGVEDARQLRLPNRTGEYIYLRGAQNTSLVEYAKYVLIFPNHDVTAMVTANIPRAALTAGLMSGPEIEAILASAVVQLNTPDSLKLFKLGYLGPFEEDLSILGTTKAYRLKSTESDNGLKPIFLVAPSLSQAPIPKLAFFAERSFNDIDQVRDKKLEEIRSFEISGLSAVEAVGSGNDVRSGVPMLIYQVVIEARHGGYFRIIGLARHNSRDRLLPEFRAITRSFEPAAEPALTQTA